MFDRRSLLVIFAFFALHSHGFAINEDPRIDSGKTPFCSGLGSREKPYIICSVRTLKNVSTTPGAYFFLVTDLDLKNQPFTPLLLKHGIFNGNYHKISNLTLRTTEEVSQLGFFAKIEEGSKVLFLNFENATIEAPHAQKVGVLAGEVENSDIQVIRVLRSRVEGKAYVGGVIGKVTRALNRALYDYDWPFNGSKSELGELEFGGGGVLYATEIAGGLVGQNGDGRMAYSAVTARKISGRRFVGGLVGINAGSVINSMARMEQFNGMEDGNGGLVGRNTPLKEGPANTDKPLIYFSYAYVENQYAWEDKINTNGQLVGENLGGLVRFSFAAGTLWAVSRSDGRGKEKLVQSSGDRSYWSSPLFGTLDADSVLEETVSLKALDAFNGPRIEKWMEHNSSYYHPAFTKEKDKLPISNWLSATELATYHVSEPYDPKINGWNTFTP